jgi:molybdopterin converting factor small subunit
VIVQVRFFGSRQFFTRRLSQEIERTLPQVSLSDGATVDDLLQMLNVPTGVGRPFVLVNRFYRRENVPLSDGDHVDLTLPATGGEG